MALTVPTAGSVAGRAAVVRLDAPDTGAVVAQFGAKMAEIGQQWQAEDRQRTAARAQLDITRDLGLARQEVEQIGDPAQIGTAWDAQVAAIREKYVTPDMDPQVRDQLDLTMRELGDRHGLALGNRVITLRQSQQQADWMGMQQQIAAEAVTADPETFQALLELGNAAIDQRVASGALDPATAAGEKLALERQVYGGRADALLQNDPQALLDGIAAGQWNVLGDGLAQVKTAAERAVAERAARATKDAEAAAKEQEAAIGKRLDEITAIVGKGGVAVDEAFLNDPAVKANPKYGEAAAAIALRNETPGIRTMTVAELDRQIATEKAKPRGFQYEMERLAVLESWRAEAEKKAATDPVGYMRDIGLTVPPLPDFDPANPQAYAQALAARVAREPVVQQQGYAAKGVQAIWSAAELAQVKAAADPKADPETRLALARSFAVQGEAAADRLASAVGADPVFRRATRIMGTLGDEGLASELMRGQARIQSKTVVMPTGPDQTRTFDAITGGAFDGNPAAKAELMAAAEALYADRAATIDAGDGTAWADNSAAVDAYTEAVQRVTGARQDDTGSYTIGGLQEFNGATTYLPPGVSVDALTTGWDNITRKLDVPQGYDADPAAANITRLQGSAFAAASLVPGAVPDLGSDPADILSEVQLRPVLTKDGRTTDVYELTYSINGRTITVPQAGASDGRAYRFKLPTLLREAQP